MNRFGDERNIDCSGLLAPEIQQLIVRIYTDLNPVVLGITRWQCFRPWHVPTRRINNNFLLLVQSGKESVSVNSEKRILKRGEAMLVPEYVPHSFGLAPGCDRCEHFIAHLLLENENGENPFINLASPFVAVTHPEAIFDKLATAVTVRGLQEETAAKMFCEVLFSLLQQEAIAGRFSMAKSPPVDGRIRTALQYLRRNVKSNIGVADLATAANLGEVRFRALFKDATGMTPATYVRRMRLLSAARLLTGTNDSIGKIAMDCGFSRIGYFCYAFQKQFSSSPGEFRLRMQKI
ncbi:MAG: AraC family transcriptional regulator [Victivallaceae bacterium]|nr:AraC family transcriptional regulator [Victivallaceae bacterium]